ncbi:MAG: universal stress protein [Chitinophagaceae bacterium]|nr:universal stress protein [Chitinophagaceae bacterium]
MNTLFVPTDFSPNAEKALNYAIQLAKKTKGEIILYHAVSLDELELTIRQIEIKMLDLARKVFESDGVRITSRIDEEGLTISGMAAAIIETGATLVVMGTLGNSAFKEKVFGSNTAALLGKTDVPMLVIPLLAQWKLPETILVTINKFDGDTAVLEPVFKLAGVYGATVQVATFTDTDDDYVEDFEEDEIKITAYRDLVRKKYPGTEIQAVHLASPHLRASLKNWIGNNNIDMLVMLTHKRNVIESIFNPSVTKKMTYHTDIPLLCIPVK